jgi:putative flippase GtrA
MEPMKVHGLYKDDKERRAKLLKFLKVGLAAFLIDIHMNFLEDSGNVSGLQER